MMNVAPKMLHERIRKEMYQLRMIGVFSPQLRHDNEPISDALKNFAAKLGMIALQLSNGEYVAAEEVREVRHDPSHPKQYDKALHAAEESGQALANSRYVFSSNHMQV